MFTYNDELAVDSRARPGIEPETTRTRSDNHTLTQEPREVYDAVAPNIRRISWLCSHMTKRRNSDNSFHHPCASSNTKII